MTRNLRVALGTFVLGFLLEAGTELYQWLSFGRSTPGGVVLYYVGLATTVAGFYLMYRARHEWSEGHRRNVRRGHRVLWSALAIFAGAVLAIAVVGTATDGGRTAGTPAALAWPVGGLVALAIGNFFLGLALLVDQLADRIGPLLAWSGFVWSLGIAVWAGALVGGEFSSLLRQFFTDPLVLVVSFAPVTFAIAPLFVTYALLSVAYFDAYRALGRAGSARGRRSRRAPPPAPG